MNEWSKQELRIAENLLKIQVEKLPIHSYTIHNTHAQIKIISYFKPCDILDIALVKPFTCEKMKAYLW